MKNLSEFPELLETEAIMDLFEISRAAAYRLMRKKGFPAFKIMRRYVVQKKALTKWLDRQEQQAYRYK